MEALEHQEAVGLRHKVLHDDLECCAKQFLIPGF
jgi:hypothetical protein